MGRVFHKPPCINTKKICARRNESAAKPFKSVKEQLKLCEIRKAARRAIRRDIRKFDEERVQEILELFGSTKKMKKEAYSYQN